ncbi:MAG TPA: hypothetical protein VKT76_05900 [Bradyrhizobium sp.]|nr:hypothetical protein [Bradyrhizobium sp.]
MPRFRNLLLAALVGVLFLGGGAASADTLTVPPPYVLFTDPPPDGQTATKYLPTRKTNVVNFMACGNENAFIDFWVKNLLLAGEDIGPMLIGKMMWLRDPANAGGACSGEVILSKGDVSSAFNDAAGNIDTHTPMNAADKVMSSFAPACQNVITGVTSLDSVGPSLKGMYLVQFYITAACMQSEINALASRLIANAKVETTTDPTTGKVTSTSVVRAQVGTDGALCLTDLGYGMSVPGDADVGIRDMTRLFYLDGDFKNGKFVEGGKGILDPATRAYVRDHLLTVYGGVGDDGSSPLDCNNPRISFDTPQDVLDEHDFLDKTVDDIGDAANWFARRFAIIGALLGPVSFLAQVILTAQGEAAAAGTLEAVSLAVVPITVATAAVDFTIPETENHRLMIETSRYLKNQIIIDELAGHPHITALRDEQKGVKDWLMHYMSGIMRHDFSEYNARPYQRYSQVALLNLADFAEDPQLKAAAKMVLEYTMAKFAVGSRDGIRVVPYRRRVDAMNKNQSIVEFGGPGTDFSVLMMQYFAGLSHHLPIVASQADNGPNPHFAPHDVSTQRGLPYGNAKVMIYPASSTFAPDQSIVDLAVDKSVPYFQRVHHDAIEVYFSTPAFTLTAGGIAAPPGHQLLLDDADTHFGGQFTDDNGGPGTGVPTSLIFEGAPPLQGATLVPVNRLAMMGFEGAVSDVGHICQPADSLPTNNPKDTNCPGNTGFGDKGRTYDRNACVWSGFACGFNYRDDQNDTGVDLGVSASCFAPGLDNAPPQWSFLKSSNCRPLAGSKTTTFVARYLLSCDGHHDCAKGRRFGFFEAVDATGDPSDAAFDAFRRKVVASNPSVFPNNDTSSGAIDKEGSYQTFSGASLRFKIGGDASHVTQVLGRKVPDISDWPFLDGDVLNAKGDGIVTFVNPVTKQSILWDFSDDDNSKRTPP